MSTLYYMTCHACKKALWVAQNNVSGFSLYSGEPKTMEKLRLFFSEHNGSEHPLEMASEHRIDDVLEQGYIDLED